MLHRLKAEASGNDSSRGWRLKPLLAPLKRAKVEGAAPLPRVPLTGCPLPGTPPPRSETRHRYRRLLGNVRFDDLVGHVATAPAEVAPCPDMAAPKPLAQVRKPRQEAIGASLYYGDTWNARALRPHQPGPRPTQGLWTRLE